MNTEIALEKTMQLSQAIHEKASQIAEAAENHFGYDPDNIHWGHVGTLGQINEYLDFALAQIDAKLIAYQYQKSIFGETESAVKGLQRATDEIEWALRDK